jgi:hypothetical protein
MKHFEVLAIDRGVVVLLHPTHKCKAWLVEHLRCCNAAADLPRIRKELLCLNRSPDAVRIAHPGTHRKRSNDLRVHRMREIDYAPPLLARQHSSKACRWRRLSRIIRILKIGRVSPCPADPHIRRSQPRRRLTEPRIRKINRGAITMQRRIHTRRR